MSRLDVRHNLDDLAKATARMRRKQMPYALELGVNKTARDFQKRQRRHMRRIFKVRDKRWVDNSVKLKPKATKQRARARVSITPPGKDGPRRSNILTKFETQTRKKARGNRLAIPIEVRRGASGVTKKMRMKNLRFREVRPGYYVGEQDTHMVLTPGGRGYVFQRYGRGKKQTRLVYSFKPSVPIKNNLDFRKNAKAIVKLVWHRNMRQGFLKAIRTAR